MDIDDVGLFLAEAVQLMGTLEAANVHERGNLDALPSGLITCGEACRMIPAVIALSMQLYPSLTEEGVLEAIIRKAEIAGAGGAMN
jgi:hypothetical protein